MVVSILEGVNADGTANMSLAGTWYQVAQQVSLSSDNTLELLMHNPLPPMPQGGYYVIEITGGFINNSIVGNNLDLSGKSSDGHSTRRRGLWKSHRRQHFSRRNDI